MKIPKCIIPFLQNTQEGERNNNFFKAMKHIRKYNRKTTKKQLINYALELNKQLKPPLPETEIRTLCGSITRKNYKSSCNNFNNFCKRCNVGSRKRPYKFYRKNYWKTINSDNTITRSLTNGVKLYPWDVMDTSLLNNEQVKMVHELRENKGINPIIDNVLKLRGIKIGDDALKEYETYRGL